MDTKEAEREAVDFSDVLVAEGDKDTHRVYEVGYHLLPTLSDEALSEAAASVVDLLKKADAEIIGERPPAKVQLAYAIEKKIDGARQSFDTAHFGWVAFEATGTALPELEQALKTNPNILRFILIKTSRDAVAATLADPSLDVAALVDSAAGETSPEEEGTDSAEKSATVEPEENA